MVRKRPSLRGGGLLLTRSSKHAIAKSQILVSSFLADFFHQVQGSPVIHLHP